MLKLQSGLWRTRFFRSKLLRIASHQRNRQDCAQQLWSPLSYQCNTLSTKLPENVGLCTLSDDTQATGADSSLQGTETQGPYLVGCVHVYEDM